MAKSALVSLVHGQDLHGVQLRACLQYSSLSSPWWPRILITMNLALNRRDTQETARTTMSAFVTRPSEWQYVTCWRASASVQRPYGPLWRNRFWNIMIFMKQFAKTDFIYKDRACRIRLARSEGILTTSLCSAACSLSSKEFGRNTGVRLWI